MRAGSAVWIALLSFGCSSPPAPKRPVVHAVPERRTEPLPHDVVERAAGPYYGVRRSDGVRLEGSSVLEELSTFDAICLGEQHDEPADHFLQMEVLRRLAERAPQSGRRLALGLEMVALPFQSTLAAYGAFTIDEPALLERTEWRERWGFDFSLYRPILELARRSGVQLVALNAPKETTRAVARQGLQSLAPKLRARLPSLDLGDREHRAFFDAAMRGHPMKHTDAERLYAAQVVWDETMAATASRWLSRTDQARQIVILAGAGHCHRSAIPRRLERRAPARVASVRLIDASSRDDEDEGPRYDYDLVLGQPTVEPKRARLSKRTPARRSLGLTAGHEPTPSLSDREPAICDKPWFERHRHGNQPGITQRTHDSWG